MVNENLNTTIIILLKKNTVLNNPILFLFSLTKETLLESGDFNHSESGENRQSESNNKDQSPGLYLLN